MSEALEELKQQIAQRTQAEIPVNGRGNQADEPEATPIFKRLSFTELIQRPAKKWLIENLIGEQDLAMIFGDAGTGKTFTAVDLIFCAILGRQFAGKFNIARPLSVAYCASEGIGGLPQRFCAVANHYQVTPDQTDNLHLFLDVPQLFDAKAITSVSAFVNDWKDYNLGELDLLIIDTLHGATWGADENQSKDAGLILRAMKYARDMLGCSVLLNHHANRQGTYRGSSAFHGALDSMFQTKIVSDNIFSLECPKQKDEARFAPLYFRLTPEHNSQSVYVEWVDKMTVDLNDDPTPQTTKAKADILSLLEDAPGMNQTQLVEQLGKYGRVTIRRALDELQKDEAIQYGKGPRNSTIYTLSELSHIGQLDNTTDN